MAPRIFIFSIVMDADYSFYVKTIATYARAFLALNVLAIGRVKSQRRDDAIACDHFDPCLCLRCHLRD